MSRYMKPTSPSDLFTIEALQDLAFYDSLSVTENPTVLSQIEHLKTLVNMVEGEPETRPLGLIGEMIRTIATQNDTIKNLEMELEDIHDELKQSNRVVAAMENDMESFNLFDPDTGHSMRVKYGNR